MSTLTKAIQAAKTFLNGINIKAPWKYTGINSSFEYQDYVIRAETYRTPSPASPKIQYHVPDSEPEHLLDIGYFNRKYVGTEANRRAGTITYVEELEGKPFMKVFKNKKLLPVDEYGPDGGYVR